MFQDGPYRNSVTQVTERQPAGGHAASHRGRPRSDRVHRAILDAARELLIRDGYTRLRLEHVAAHAGVGKATIYRRWPDKEKLAQALLADLAAPHIAIEGTGDTREEMLAAVMNPMRALTETEFGPVIRALLSQIATNPALGDPFRATVVQARRDEIGRMIARGIERGDLRADADPDVATELLVGPVYFRLMFGGELDEAFAERVVDNVMRGYTAPGRRSGPRPAKPGQAGPGPAAPVEAGQAGPGPAKSAEAGPAQAAPIRAKLAHPDPGGAELAHPDPGGAELGSAGPSELKPSGGWHRG